MMNESERAKVREYFRNHPDMTQKDVERLLGRETDFMEIIEAGLIMADVVEHAEAGAPETKPTTETEPDTARCRLEIEFSAERTADGYTCNAVVHVPPAEKGALGFLLRTAVGQFRDELAEAMTGGMLRRAFKSAERKFMDAAGHPGKGVAE